MAVKVTPLPRRPRGAGPTKMRALRVPDEVWEAAKERAHAEGTTVAAVVTAALASYARRR